jgi:hypothetical protein
MGGRVARGAAGATLTEDYFEGSGAIPEASRSRRRIERTFPALGTTDSNQGPPRRIERSRPEARDRCGQQGVGRRRHLRLDRRRMSLSRRASRAFLAPCRRMGDQRYERHVARPPALDLAAVARHVDRRDESSRRGRRKAPPPRGARERRAAAPGPLRRELLGPRSVAAVRESASGTRIVC